MGWYVKELSRSEKLRRRELLDNAGYISLAAQVLFLFLLAAIRLFLQSQHSALHTPPPTISKLKWRLFYAPVFQKYPQMGTPALWIGAVIYSSWQLLLALRGSNEDYLHLTKVFGTLAASNLPLHFLLAAKARTRFHEWIFGNVAHDKLNILHRWLGRLIFTFISFHALLYLQYFWDSSKMTTRLLEFDVICGVIGYLMMLTIYITSFSLVRHTRSWYFPVFYVTHVALAISLFPLLWLHVEHIRLHLGLAGFVWLCDYTVRWFSTQWGEAEVTMAEDGNMLEVNLTLNTPSTALAIPGAHLFLTVPKLHKLRGGLRLNPFTVAAVSDGGRNLKLVMRLGEGFTKSLLHHTTPSSYVALENAGDGVDEKPESVKAVVSLFVPSQSTLPNLGKYNRILFVAGGVGGSFCVPWVKHLLVQLAAEKAEPARTIRFIWSVKDVREANWAITSPEPTNTESSQQDFNSLLELYVTAESTSLGESEDSQSPKSYPLQTITQAPKTFTRPNLNQIIDEEFMACVDGENMAVLVCGPADMTETMRAASGRLIGKRPGVGLWFWEEGFGY